MARTDTTADALLDTGVLLGAWPLALLQGAFMRGVTGSAPAPAGPLHGWAGEADAPGLRLLVLGESTALAVGADDPGQGLAPRLAFRLGLRLQRRVDWQVRGGVGWTAARLREDLRRHGVPGVDVAVVTVGVSDALQLTRSEYWRRDVLDLARQLLRAGARMVVFSGLPPIRDVPGWPWPLGRLLERRLRRFDALLAQGVTAAGVAPECSLLHVPLPRRGAGRLVSADGIHPSAAGYAHWAQWLAAAVIDEWQALPGPVLRLAR